MKTYLPFAGVVLVLAAVAGLLGAACTVKTPAEQRAEVVTRVRKAEPPTYDLQCAEETELHLICCRFGANEGISCVRSQ